MKKNLKIVICLAILLFSTACANGVQNNNNINDSIKFKQEYEALNNDSIVMSIDESNSIKYVDFDEVINILTTGTGVIYFGFPGCPWCRNMIPVLFDVADTNNIDTIYYYNPRDIRTSGEDDYQQLIKLLENYLEIDEDNNKRLYVPDVYFVRDGQIMGHHLSTVASQTDPFIPLTSEQKKELENIYQDLFDKIK